MNISIFGEAEAVLIIGILMVFIFILSIILSDAVKSKKRKNKLLKKEIDVNNFMVLEESESDFQTKGR